MNAQQSIDKYKKLSQDAWTARKVMAAKVIAIVNEMQQVWSLRTIAEKVQCSPVWLCSTKQHQRLSVGLSEKIVALYNGEFKEMKR